MFFIGVNSSSDFLPDTQLRSETERSQTLLTFGGCQEKEVTWEIYSGTILFPNLITENIRMFGLKGMSFQD